MSIKNIFTAIFLLLFINTHAEELPEDEILKERVSKLESCVKPKFNSVLKGYIRTYTVNKRSKSELILGRVLLYFPLFEKALADRNLPTELKYLSITESALNPLATSRSNAAGLWQFMAPTAKEYGLQIDYWVDERRDPIRATDAALTYLEKLHSMYGDWALALAAYNGGPGRVNRAIKRSRTKNFWKLRRFLPKETQNYVTAYLGACYLMQYHKEHQLKPVLPELDLQIIGSAKVYKRLDLQELSKVTQVPLWKLQYLNPSYQQNIIPQRTDGNYITVPKRVLNLLMDYVNNPQGIIPQDVSIQDLPEPKGGSDMNNFELKKHIVSDRETIRSISTKYKISHHHLMAWNDLIRNQYLESGKELKIFHPKDLSVETSVLSTMKKEPLALLPSPTLNKLKYNSSHLNLRKSSTPIIHIVKKKQTIQDIAKEYNIGSVNTILRYNNINKKNSKRLKAGSSIYIPSISK